MAENTRKDDFLPETLMTAAVGSPESRAAARRMLQGDPTKPPPYICICCAGRIGAPEAWPVRLNRSWSRAEILHGRKFIRGEGESAADFERRVIGEVPVIPRPGTFGTLVLLYSDDVDTPPDDGEWEMALTGDDNDTYRGEAQGSHLRSAS